jgi:hypothetical protein
MPALWDESDAGVFGGDVMQADVTSGTLRDPLPAGTMFWVRLPIPLIHPGLGRL